MSSQPRKRGSAGSPPKGDDGSPYLQCHSSSSSSSLSSDSRDGPPTNPAIVHPGPAPPGYHRVKGNLIPDKGENWLPPAREPKDVPEDVLNKAQALSLKRETRGRFIDSRSTTPKYTLAQRKAYNKSGREVEVVMNALPIIKFPTKPIFQYEVNALLGKWKASAGANDPPEMGQYMEKDEEVLRKVFYRSQARKERLPDAIYDGKHIAWSLTGLDTQLRDKFEFPSGWKRPVGSRGDVYGQDICLIMSVRRKIFLGTINEWLEKKRPFDERVMESLNFLDHLIRDYPAQQFVALKRSYFFDKFDSHPDPELRKFANESYWPLLRSGATCYRGVFQTIKPSPHGLFLNVDISHGVFYSRNSLLYLLQCYLKKQNPKQVPELFECQWVDGARTETWQFTYYSKALKGLRVRPDFEGYPENLAKRTFAIAHLINGDSNEFVIPVEDKATGKINKMSLNEYYKTKYNYTIEFPKTALVQTTRPNVVFPMEILVIHGLQRWPHKLDEAATADMIKYTAVKPAGRLSAIEKCNKILNHEHDPNLIAYGMKIGSNMLKTKARLLPNPEIQFGNVKHNPGTTGRWDLRGKKWLKPNTKPLQSWGIGYIVNHRYSIDKSQIEAWQDQFEKLFKMHGGAFANRARAIEMRENIGDGVKNLYDLTRTTHKAIPQLLVVIVPEKHNFSYLRIKKSCDCRFGVPSQVLQSRRCIENRPQYTSNVLMKVNAKLGGVTNRAIPRTPGSTLRPQSIIIGADVTHAKRGVDTPSLAAMCVSNDPQGVSYMGGCQTNGEWQKEIITRQNIHGILRPLLLEWNATLGKGGKPPKHIYYFRDGVSESEFNEILHKEVPAIKQVAAECMKVSTWPGKMTVVVANKRHHLRGFPKTGDKMCGDARGNPLPGLLIDRDVTGPHGWDFLLYSHTALQGTSRPVHYTVLVDEIGHKPEELENMIYEHCYQYVRSTTPVSIHPSIYYAHLITARARHHENVPIGIGPRHGAMVREKRELKLPRFKEAIETRRTAFEHQLELGKGHTEHKLGDPVPERVTDAILNRWGHSANKGGEGAVIRTKFDSKTREDLKAKASSTTSDDGKSTTESQATADSNNPPHTGLPQDSKVPMDATRLVPIEGNINRLPYKMWWI
ncbi:hypothetical protein N7532_004647 [Penicillium argentinense]|uniref:Piwi domain-containing protein n=1 Tax=Penicillium argentinense TaxID=1131581 RepID=A0A9W9FPV1_9EURO|nr:uncharacterized protein N7532_004647 [Penicillium argentinense]KAJ5104118.1 hypothetical protein N7532_004647 [Penicillium argentinense]